jgi:uncharacterized 2Fe-2S/4Fe-4S cluster protein (DUF4445 family)
VVGGAAVSDVTADERLVLTPREISEGYRLGCRCRLVEDGDVTVLIPGGSRVGTYVLLTQGEVGEEELDPATTKKRAPWSGGIPDSMFDPTDLRPPEGADYSFDPRAVASLSRLRKQDKTREIFLVLNSGKVLDVAEEPRVLGFALDIGTTKVAGYLLDLVDGKTLAVVSEINPQIAYGEDVMSRLQYALDGGLDKLQVRIVDCVNELLERACASAGVTPEEVYEVMAVGNTVMHHILTGQNLRGLAYSPYRPTATSPMTIEADQLGIRANPAAKLELPPLVAGYVGSDVVADMVATNMYGEGERSILLDIGTNTEIVVNNCGRLLTCSAASGPAFEGAHIAFGMRAATGAIDRVEISEAGETRYTVIGGTRPRGLTGSAVVDTIAECFRVGILDKSGRLANVGSNARLRKTPQGYLEYVISHGTETDMGSDVTLSQRDIREIQLAKAAIRAGLNVLMKEVGVVSQDVDCLYIAGAFGFFLNPVSARAIGLYPDVELNKVRLVGNTSVTGARAMLLSKRKRAAAESLAKRIGYVELASHKDFKTEFMRSISIPYDETERAFRSR